MLTRVDLDGSKQIVRVSDEVFADAMLMLHEDTHNMAKGASVIGLAGGTP